MLLLGIWLIATGLLQVAQHSHSSYAYCTGSACDRCGGSILVDGKLFVWGGHGIGYIVRDITAGTYYRQPEAR